MAEMMAFLPVVATALQATASIAGGIQQDRAARSVADQLNAQANTESATAQRAAAEERRMARLANSRLQAVAQGGGTDAGVVNLAGDIAAEGEYRALTSLYEGEERAASLRHSANVKRYEGKQAKYAGVLDAATTVLGNSKTMFDRYGPKGDSDTGYNIRRRR